MDKHLEAFQQVKKIYNRELAFIEGLNESQLEKRFFREIFKMLLPDFEVQATSKNQEFPDYAFFPHKQALDDAHKEKGKKSFYTGAFAVGEVKRWNAELDKFGKDKHDKRRNPSFQIWLYLHETEPRWGILSNGRKWRLYHQDKPLACYYEIDLVSLLEKDDLEGFRYFYYFFRREAFVPNEKGEIFLERVFRESVDYAKDIGDNLKENVYRSMKIISDGFLHWNQNNLDISNEDVRMEVQKSTMHLLYRLLFLLYAEGKGLLDLSDEVYRNSYSFYRLKKEISKKKDGPKNDYYLPASTTLWGRLKDLFRLIDQGSEEFNIPRELFYVPAYNGGLFDRQKNPHLERWTIGDTYLADAIDLLARNETKEGKAYVDYSTLEIRHLGSIYEGLLEYKLKIAEEDLVVKGTKKKKWVTLDEYNKGKKTKKTFDQFESFDCVKEGDIYLATDKGERKATGSYYTPDYIVNYIVENTVGSVIEDKWKPVKKEKRSMVEATLSINVLDPAMGSGHFLVGAVEYIAARLLEAVQQDIENGCITDDSHYTLDWAKREVVSHCIYGVDLNEMAVELGKLSLWLTTISKDKPLSFLDHRLKCGNSLIGADLADLPWHPDRKTERTQKRIDIPTGFIQKLVDTVDRLASIDDDTLEHVREKERIFQEFKDTREYDMIKTLADIRTSIYFGNEVEQRVYGSYTGDAYYSTESEWKKRREKGFAQKGRNFSEEMHFFHWELEYPEIFFEEGKMKEQPGFDAVIGNPPYIRQEEIKELKPYLEEKYDTFSSIADLYIYFYEEGHILLKYKGQFGFITSNKFMKTKYGKPLRGYLRNVKIKEVVDFGELPVFDDASTFPSIVLFEKIIPDKVEVTFTSIKDLKFDDLRRLVKEEGEKIGINSFAEEGWILTNPKRISLFSKMRKQSKPLSSYLDRKVNYGIKTGLNEVFIIDNMTKEQLIAEDKLSSEIIHPILAGDDIRRYSVHFANKYVIFSRRGIDINQYPAIKNYLDQFKDRLMPKPANWDSKKDGKWTGRKPGSYQWYELQDTVDYFQDFEGPKIVLPDIAMSCRFSYDEEKYYVANTGYIIPTKDFYLLSLLNSKLIELYYRNNSAVLGDPDKRGRMRFIYQYLVQIPIRRIESKTSGDIFQSTIEEGKSLYLRYLEKNNFNVFSTFLDKVLPKNKSKSEKSDVVHDLLANLAQQMLGMNKEKNEEISGFLSWLETELQTSIEDLTNKTQIKEYYKLSFEELLKIPKKNDKKIPINLSDRGFQENLKREFEKSKEVLTPLFDKIEKTDWLIDQIVYQLYGLTEEEIKIVEEAVG